MKIFNRDGKLNFVDDNNVLVGFDYYQNCCETFGYLLGRSLPVDIEDTEEIEVEGYNFDPSYCESIYLAGVYEGGAVAFRLTKGTEELFLTLYNSHNGYYGHGFEMSVHGKVVHSDAL